LRFFQRGTHKSLISLCPHRHDKINSCALSFWQHHRESRPEDYRRTFELDPSIDANKISAKIDRGVVTLTLPRAEHVKPRKITVS
jgi:hypothetical protein